MPLDLDDPPQAPATAFATARLGSAHDVLAPDGSEIRLLVATKQCSMAHGTLPPGHVSLAIVHRTVEEVWSYGPEQEWFMSPFISDADHLPETGNVLITDGGRIVGADGKQMTAFGGRHWAR